MRESKPADKAVCHNRLRCCRASVAGRQTGVRANRIDAGALDFFQDRLQIMTLNELEFAYSPVKDKVKTLREYL
jgi:hypothetical protein